MKKYLSPLSLFAILCQLIAFGYLDAQTGTWTQLATPSPHLNNGVCLLMTDGTVICKNTSGPGNGTGWDRLTPDIHGSYINGTWDTIASMINDRLYFSSQVLPSGKVYVAGGEYGSGGTAGEVYDPVANTWTLCGPLPNSSYDIFDGNSELLYDGNVLEGPQIGPSGLSEDNLLWSPVTLNYTIAPNSLYGHDEAQWLKMRDSSVLFVGINTDSSNRYIPQTNTWVNDGLVPGFLYDPLGEEAGCGNLLPNGKAVFFGATPYNAIYTPSGNISPGTWTSADSFPKIQGTYVSMDDAPGAMMVNGHMLLAVSPAPTSSSEFIDPIYFVEYNYVTNTFAQVKSIIPYTGGDSIPNQTSYQAGMLDLPDGTVLVSVDQSSSYSTSYLIYTPGSGPIPQGIPTINSILPAGCPNYIITGKLFNGISEGATYGDDWQNSTNYPLIRLTNGTDVYYAKTTNWNRIGAVQTDSLEDSAYFAVPTLPPGTYSLVVIANGFASNPTLFSVFGLTAISETNISCGSGGGSATVTLSGGLSPYTYLWSDVSSQTTATATGLSAGTYTVIMSDNNACSASATVAIVDSGSSLTVGVMVISNATCLAGGSDSAFAVGGSSPYTYQWSDANSQTTAVATGLSAGIYTVTVTDSTGCSGTASDTITAPTGLTVTATVIANATCTTGGIDSASVSGGVSPYTYLWSDANSQTTAIATGLVAGSYTVTVTDSNGCSGTASTVIIRTSSLVVTAIVTANANCSIGGSDSASVSGGISPYTYLWSDANSQTTVSATGLSAGTYTVTVTDSSGCSGTASSIITQPIVLNLTATVIANVSCDGGSNGADSVSVSGGVSPYTYLWNDANSQTTATATGLSAGTYAVTVMDSNGCFSTISNIINQPAALTGSAGVTSNVICNGGNSGSASAFQSGGTSPYTYLWSDVNSQTTASANGLSAGTYTVTLQDSCGASVTASVIITQPNPLSVTANSTGSGCGGNGTASSSVSGGTSPYTYLWSDVGSQTTAIATGLSTGSYTVTVQDGCGATATSSVSVFQTAPLVVFASSTASGCNVNNGTATASASGGTSPYTYSWSDGAGTNASVSGLSGGTYMITVTDSCGSQATAAVTINQSVVTITIASRVIEVCAGFGYITAHAAIGGVPPYTYTWTPSGGTNLATTSNLGAGTYTITATDNNGCSGTASESITLPPQLTVTANLTGAISCYGGNNGSVSATAGGGISPYTYSWFPSGGTNSTEGGLSAGIYIITVTDTNGCISTASVTLGQPSGMTITHDSVAQNGLCDGLAAVTVTGGGTPPYTYLWTSGGQTTDTIQGLCAGSYCCTITGNNGCAQSTCITIQNATGIDNIENGAGISVYPNPNSGIFTVELSVGSGQSIVEIYNILGEKIMTQELTNTTNVIDLSTQPSGIYLYRALKENGSLIGTGKIIIQK